MLVTSALIVFPALMAFAASSDLLTMTISNRISLALVAAFLAFALILRVPLDVIGWNLALGAIVLLITFSFFAMGWIGGGDAKLAAATAVWLGWSHILAYGMLASVFGAVLTIAIILLRRHPLPGFLVRQEWAARLHDNKSGVPYGIALAAAALMIYPETVVFLGLARS